MIAEFLSENDSYTISSEGDRASFDGMTIKTDSLMERSTNRVLPILEEEQIFMCRQMLPRLKPGDLVLDVGTGSGVFAIWAAKQKCQVVAIDINHRALEMARLNAHNNEIKTFDQPEELTNGSICFLLERFDQDFNRGIFDTVILAPPYNPTYPGITTATHAQAGEDGQECFNEQITLVPKLLKQGGYCIGNQMTTVENGNLTFLNKIAESFENRCNIFYTRIIGEDISMKDFLKQQYNSYLQQKGIGSFIGKNVALYEKFSLVYYEIIKSGEDLKIIEFQHEQLLQSGWNDRIALHCAIVDNIQGII